jgi:peptidoglycan/xylan/chitin deacetylase (PgdA/CDA1 family)
MISDADVKHIKHLYRFKTVKEFISDLDYLIGRFNPIHLNDLLARTKSGRQLPSKAFLLTFDDGFREMHDIVAPILLQKGIPATFFINSAFTDNRTLCYQHKASLIVAHLPNVNLSKPIINEIDRLLPQNLHATRPIAARILAIEYSDRAIVDKIADVLEMDTDAYLRNEQPYLLSEQIRNLIQQGFSIGAHSIDHPRYRDLTLDEQVRQTTESMHFVKLSFNLNYGAFAFPHSDYGISSEYFRRVQETGLVDISFGTAGMIEDCVPNHFQRFSLEKKELPAKRIIEWQFARKCYGRVRRRNVLMRP